MHVGPMIHRNSFLKKKKVYFHLTVRVSPSRMTEIQMDEFWTELPKTFKRQTYLEVHACVLMSNHFHALISTDEGLYEMTEVVLRTEFRNKLWLGTTKDDFFDMTRINSFAGYREVYRYIYTNPVEARLVPLAELYKFSTLGEVLGMKKKQFFANDNMGLITNPYSILGWLNRKIEQEYFH